MSRADYVQIKERFGGFVSALRDADGAAAAGACFPDARAYLSVTQAEDGACSIAEFARSFPRTDVLHMAICNFVCRIDAGSGSVAQQSAYVVCTALNRTNDPEHMDYFQFVMIFSNRWERAEDGAWRMSCIRMETYDQGGPLKELFARTWHFEETLAVLKPGVHMPCVHGELDAPWYAVPNAEDVLTPEEQVIESFVRYDFGVDHMAFSHVDAVLSDRFHSNAQPHETDGKREWMTTVKFHRQKSRQWAHPYRFLSVDINGDSATVRCLRLFGERHEFAWTDGNACIERAGADCMLAMEREHGVWRLVDFQYESKAMEIGAYADDLYGDLC